MERVASPVSALNFMPTFSSGQDSESEKANFEPPSSSVNCFAEVVVTQHYPDISRYSVLLYNLLNDTGYSFERNCVLRRWESETLK